MREKPGSFSGRARGPAPSLERPRRAHDTLDDCPSLRPPSHFFRTLLPGSPGSADAPSPPPLCWNRHHTPVELPKLHPELPLFHRSKLNRIRHPAHTSSPTTDATRWNVRQPRPGIYFLGWVRRTPPYSNDTPDIRAKSPRVLESRLHNSATLFSRAVSLHRRDRRLGGLHLEICENFGQ
jgi:hypothetical protein